MQNYDQGLEMPIVLPANDFGAGDATRDYTGPSGKRGRIVGLSLGATETFNAVTTSAKVRVGTAADDDAYMEYDVGTLAAGAGVILDEHDTNLGLITNAAGEIVDLPADTEFRVSMIAPTGGTPAGIADVALIIRWF